MADVGLGEGPRLPFKLEEAEWTEAQPMMRPRKFLFLAVLSCFWMLLSCFCSVFGYFL